MDKHSIAKEILELSEKLATLTGDEYSLALYRIKDLAIQLAKVELFK